MMRQASSRNQRNKGLKLKNIIQICLLVAVFFWLLYQLKHSYDKKKGLNEHGSRILNNVVDHQAEFLDIGRKGLPKNDNPMASDDSTHKDEEENEEIEEEEDRNSHQAVEDEEAKGNGDDRIDEQDNEQTDEQDDQGRGDEEAEDGDETVNEEEKDDQVEEAEFLVDQKHEEGSSQEAHEERYKKDDASSAVHQENQVTETEDRNSRADDEQLQNNENDVEAENKSRSDNAHKEEVHEERYKKDDASGAVHQENQVTEIENKTSRAHKEQLQNNENDTETGGKNGVGDNAHEDGNNTNIPVVFSTVNDNILNNSQTIIGAGAEKVVQDLSHLGNQTMLQDGNSMIPIVSDNQVRLQTAKPVAVTSNETEVKPDSLPFDNVTVIMGSDDNQNTTITLRITDQEKPNLKSVVERQPNKSNTTIGLESLENLEDHSAVTLPVNENGDAVEGDAAGSSHRMAIEEERDSRVDLSTLPDVQNDVMKSIEDEAAE
ncbi:Myb-like protein X [Canna indica]|uniref:Myb-like protein X n=1 Tax=Canna indica TaxID=4628 RepID=A0AAQ3QEC3_9LILI|nr:Myb-like protein X [Canna indica]